MCVKKGPCPESNDCFQDKAPFLFFGDESYNAKRYNITMLRLDAHLPLECNGRSKLMAIRIMLSTRLGERRWTQADLARATGIRPSTINEMYHEICERVNLDHLDLICEALDCEVQDILVRVPEREPRTKSRLGK